MGVTSKTCRCGCGKLLTNSGGQQWSPGCAPNCVRKKTRALAYEPMPERPESCEKCGSQSIYLDTPVDVSASDGFIVSAWTCLICSWTRFVRPGTAVEGNYETTRAPRPRR